MHTTNEHTAENSAGTDVAYRPEPARRSERVTAWLGWRLPELAGLGATGLAGALHWPGWWAGTAAALGWIGWTQLAPLIRRARTRRTDARHDTDEATTTELESPPSDPWKETG